jgi:hypothetical protein
MRGDGGATVAFYDNGAPNLRNGVEASGRCRVPAHLAEAPLHGASAAAPCCNEYIDADTDGVFHVKSLQQSYAYICWSSIVRLANCTQAGGRA